MYCNKCGKPVDGGNVFCNHCGARLANAPTASTQRVPVPPQAPNGAPTQEQTEKNKGCLKKLLIVVVVAIVIVLGVWLITTVLGDIPVDPNPPYNPGGPTYNDNPSGNGGVQGTSLDLSGLRKHFTTLKGDGTDVATIMVYLCGSNLETDSGCATTDLVEMIEAAYSDNVNIIVQTGGTERWQNDVMSASKCERYRIEEDGIRNLNSKLSLLDMTKYTTLRDFIKFCKTNYPADRYMLVMWDHGGGTMGGFGYDENFSSSGGMSLSAMDKALSEAGVKFDIVGFDACLMATIETAYMLKDHADYLVASEETEPGTGWYYTTWLNALAANPSIPTRELGKSLIDSYIDSTTYRDQATLSLIELREVDNLYQTMCSFLSTAEARVTDQNFVTLSQARSNSKSYGENGYDQIDLVDFVKITDLDKSDEVVAAMNSLVAYRRGSNIDVAYGLAMYFPYSWLEHYTNILALQKNIGMGTEYTGFFGDFVSVMAGGQAPSSGGTGTENRYADEDWFNAELVENYGDYYEDYSYNELEITEKTDSNGDTYFALELSDNDWKIISQIEIQAFLDDEEGGFIDLGSDNIFEADDDGALMITFDNTWVALDGNVVSFYYLYETPADADNWYTYGYTPAELNGEVVDLILRWDEDNQGGYVAGWRAPSSDSQQAAKGLVPLKQGDKLRFMLDYYTPDGEYEDTYFYGFGELVVGNDGELEVSYEDVGEFDVFIWYMITDIYGNYYTTESVRFYS